MEPNALIAEIDAALDAHSVWRRKLTTTIRTGTCDTPIEQVCADDCCAFGKWLYGPSFDAATKARKPYQVTKRLHAEFHESAGRIARLAEKGMRGEAYSILDNEFAARSDTLTRALQKWRAELSR